MGNESVVPFGGVTVLLCASTPTRSSFYCDCGQRQAANDADCLNTSEVLLRSVQFTKKIKRQHKGERTLQRLSATLRID
eukprot:NODE_5084_length_324_cov_280.610909_g4473_i0.p1 GENE.NODE_5084_length_324_cov_280.610909_g4473_i0~~NODE_5084_length_324_cov_280.610909_g4473_i0.p1  ORF type:complete len:86 (+),score=15.10 NODE_5084_length_324_cov_280.610909_g4473_i0:22-258(+)